MAKIMLLNGKKYPFVNEPSLKKAALKYKTVWLEKVEYQKRSNG